MSLASILYTCRHEAEGLVATVRRIGESRHFPGPGYRCLVRDEETGAVIEQTDWPIAAAARQAARRACKIPLAGDVKTAPWLCLDGEHKGRWLLVTPDGETELSPAFDRREQVVRFAELCGYIITDLESA